MKYTMTPANKRLLAASGILLGLTAMPLQKSVIAQELGSHVHGLTELNLVITNQNVQIEFISPAINLLGFERASNSPEENKLFNEVLEDLQAAEWLLGDQLRDCQMSTPVFEAPEFGSHEMSMRTRTMRLKLVTTLIFESNICLTVVQHHQAILPSQRLIVLLGLKKYL